MDWYQVKLFVQHGSGISMDALHVIAGVCGQLAAAAIFRMSVSRAAPWLIVFGAEIVNEIRDFSVETWPDWGMQWGEAAKDLALTMFLPTIILLAARYKAVLFARSKEAPTAEDTSSLRK